jgi:hypothetical protein
MPKVKDEGGMLLKLTSREVDWLCQDVSRQVVTLQLFLKDLYPDELKIATRNALRRSLETLRKSRDK